MRVIVAVLAGLASAICRSAGVRLSREDVASAIGSASRWTSSWTQVIPRSSSSGRSGRV